MEEIRNRVKESGLIALDLADFKPNASTLAEVDIADQLWQGIALKEKDFRAWIKSNDWNQYADKNVYVHCSVDAIIPTWAYMLVGAQLEGISNNYIIGSKGDLENLLITNIISEIDVDQYKDQRLIIKGCADITNPAFAMVEFLKRVQPVAKSIMYGEPCSTVPIFKKK